MFCLFHYLLSFSPYTSLYISVTYTMPFLQFLHYIPKVQEKKTTEKTSYTRNLVALTKGQNSSNLGGLMQLNILPNSNSAVSFSVSFGPASPETSMIKHLFQALVCVSSLNTCFSICVDASLSARISASINKNSTASISPLSHRKVRN